MNLGATHDQMKLLGLVLHQQHNVRRVLHQQLLVLGVRRVDMQNVLIGLVEALSNILFDLLIIIAFHVLDHGHVVPPVLGKQLNDVGGLLFVRHKYRRFIIPIVVNDFLDLVDKTWNTKVPLILIDLSPYSEHTQRQQSWSPDPVLLLEELGRVLHLRALALGLDDPLGLPVQVFLLIELRQALDVLLGYPLLDFL